MVLSNKKIKRLGIYFFFDKDGIVDQFITYFLADLVKSLDRLVIVCNGETSVYTIGESAEGLLIHFSTACIGQAAYL